MATAYRDPPFYDQDYTGPNLADPGWNVGQTIAGTTIGVIPDLTFAASEALSKGSTAGYVGMKSALDNSASALGATISVGTIGSNLYSDLSRSTNSYQTWDAVGRASIDLLGAGVAAGAAAAGVAYATNFALGFMAVAGIAGAAPVILPATGLAATIAAGVAIDYWWDTSGKQEFYQIFQNVNTGVQSFVGRAADGPIADATIFVDANRNGRLDPGEPWSHTDSTGAYHFSTSVHGPLTVIGGTDSITGEPMIGSMTLHDGQQIVTPLTTLANLLEDHGYPEANLKTLFALNLPTTSFDIRTYDPVNAALSGSSLGAKTYVAGAEIAVTANSIAALFIHAGPASQVLHLAYDVLSRMVPLLPFAGDSSGPISARLGLASASQIQQYIESMELVTGVNLSSFDIGQAANHIASLNSQLDAIFSSGITGSFLLNQVGNIQATAASELSDAAQTATWQESLFNLNEFSWDNGWVDNSIHPRDIVELNHQGTAAYLAFGTEYTFLAIGGRFAVDSWDSGSGFSDTIPAIHDFGTAQGYTPEATRGAAVTGYGPSATIYGQGYAGIYWYGATSDAVLGPNGDATVPVYEDAPHLYNDFGTHQGWSVHNGFDIVFTQPSDTFASILGFGSDGIIVGPNAFSPHANSSQIYLISIAVGNNAGWDQLIDVRTFQDNKGGIIDLNHDSIVDFVGMGPNGLVFAFGKVDANQNYDLGALQTADFGEGPDLGRAQGWTNANTLRMVVHNQLTGFDDIVAFGDAGVVVAPGQDPATHNGQPFGEIYLALEDMGLKQGWSNDLTPRLIGDVNGDGIADIVGFGANQTFTALGSIGDDKELYFEIDPTKTINDFGFEQGWSIDSTIRKLADVTNSGHDSIVLSGATGTHVWDFV